MIGICSTKQNDIDIPVKIKPTAIMIKLSGSSVLGPTIKLNTPEKNKPSATNLIGFTHSAKYITNMAIKEKPPVILKKTRPCKCTDLVKSSSLNDKTGS